MAEIFICTAGEVDGMAWQKAACLPAASVLTLPAALYGDPSAYITANTPQNAVILFVAGDDYHDQLPPAIVDGGQVIACQSATLPTVGWLGRAFDASLLQEKGSRSRLAMLAQWHPYYLDKGRYWLEQLSTHPDRVVCNWMADEVGKYSLLACITKGIDTCVYFGHGRPGKLVGYHGITGSDFSVVNAYPIGSMLSFSCYATTRKQHMLSFGEQLVNQGRAVMFWGSREASEKRQNSEIEALMLRRLQQTGLVNMVTLLRDVNHSLLVRTDKALLRLWRSYTLLGNPFQTL